MLQIKWTTPARVSLDDQTRYIAKENPIIADKVVSHIYSLTQHLKSNPNMGRVGRVFGTRELVSNKYPFIIAYRVDNNFVEILQIVHMSRQYPPKF